MGPSGVSPLPEQMDVFWACKGNECSAGCTCLCVIVLRESQPECKCTLQAEGREVGGPCAPWCGWKIGSSECYSLGSTCNSQPCSCSLLLPSYLDSLVGPNQQGPIKVKGGSELFN